MEIVSKMEFARLVGVGPSCVSQWIARGKLGGDALVGNGNRSRIRVDAAREQLQKNLDISQHLGMNGKAKLGPQKRAAKAREAPCAVVASFDRGKSTGGDDPADDETVEDQIKQARLAQLALANNKARAEAALRAGRYLKAEDARQEMGRVAARLLAVMESSLAEMANALAAEPATSSRDTLRTLRTAWRGVRARAAKAIGAETGAIEPLIDEEEAA
jgi:DNA-binding transcriptional regulator YdaS (Cro superfamily)